jgi:general secretion pathway protein B
MSYILDALKKAERERAIAQVPTLMSIHDVPSETSPKRPWIIAGICLLSATALILVAIFMLKQMGSKTASPSADKSDGLTKQSQEAVSAAKDEPPKATVPSQDSTDGEKRTEAREMPVATPLGKRLVPESGFPAEPRKTPESATMIPRPFTTPLSSPSNSAASISEKAPEPETTQTGVASLREAMAKMTMTIHMYSEDKSERMVFINDRKYLEGDYVEGNYLLQSITQEGAVLSYQGERALLRPKTR